MKFLAAVLLTASCAHAAVVSEYYKPPKSYPPTSEVEVFRTQRPTRPYEEIAELQTRNPRKPTEDLVRTAKQVGADAIIIVGAVASPVGAAVPVGGIMVTTRRNVTTAIAIRYTNQGGTQE